MTLTVHIPTALRRYTGGTEVLTCSAATLPELLAHLEERFPGLGVQLRDTSGQLRPFLNVYVNEEDIRFLGGPEYQFKDGDEVMLVPSIAGGSGTEAGPVVVPATSANLGCAFDCAALALDLHLVARVRRSEAGVDVTYHGPNPERVPGDASNLVVQGLHRLATWAGIEPGGLRVEIESRIPVAVGLGSSAAARLAGILLGARLYGVEADEQAVLRLAAELEGHADNVAAAYYGGLVLVATGEPPGEVLTARTSLPADLKLVAVIPEVAVPTEQARAVLPSQYSRTDAVHNLQRAALLAARCFSGEFELVPELFRDRWHQRYRSALVPGLANCLELRQPGLLGVFLSGAGSSVLALARHSTEAIAAHLVAAFAREGVRARVLLLQPDNAGARYWELQARAAGALFPAAASARPAAEAGPA